MRNGERAELLRSWLVTPELADFVADCVCVFFGPVPKCLIEPIPALGAVSAEMYSSCSSKLLVGGTSSYPGRTAVTVACRKAFDAGDEPGAEAHQFVKLDVCR